MAEIDQKYHKLLETILEKGRWYEDPNRKGVKRLQIPSYTFEHDMTKGFPAITTKKLAWKSVVGELLWFLKGDTNIRCLLDNSINIWNKDAYNFYVKNHKTIPASYEVWLKELKYGSNVSGNLGRVYGAQWKKWNAVDHCDISEDGFTSKYIDQISNIIKNLKEQPLATDHIVTAWNPAELDKMALPPCHNFFQINVWELELYERNHWTKEHIGNGYQRGMLTSKECDEIGAPKYGFELVWNQRSVDTFLGLPFNIASYGLLAYIIGKITNMIPMSLKGNLNNVHIYDNSLEGVDTQIIRDVNKYDASKVRIRTATNRIIEKFQDNIISLDEMLDKFEINQFVLEDYESYPSIKVEMLERN